MAGSKKNIYVKMSFVTEANIEMYYLIFVSEGSSRLRKKPIPVKITMNPGGKTEKAFIFHIKENILYVSLLKIKRS